MIYTKNIQHNLLTLAPDALVFINGKDTIGGCSDCNCGLRLKEVITAISTDLSVNSSPGSATISISNPQHINTPLLDKTHQAFAPMQEVEIYIRGQFLKNQAPAYYPVFWGFITGINENYSDGAYSLSLSCKDILRWWEISKVNVKPGTLSKNFAAGINPTIFSKTYSNLTIPEIIRSLASISVSELLTVRNISTTVNSDKINDIVVDNFELLQYWNQRFSQIGRALRIFGFNGEELDNANLRGVQNTNFDESISQDTLGDKEEESPKRDIQTNQSFIEPVLGINGPEIDTIYPSLLIAEGTDLFDTNFESKLEIANTVKEVIKYEFYMDVNGEVIFKPPFYNMDVRENPISIIEAIDIIDWGFTEDEGAVITRADVSGKQSNFDSTRPEMTPVYGIYMDYFRALQYGLRVQNFEVNYLRSAQQCEVYAQSEISRLNALIKSGSITIIGRPELRLGYPIYCVPRDSFYYVTGISHNFTFGASYTTTLSLTAERKKIRNADGSVRKNLAIIYDDVEGEKLTNAFTSARALRLKDVNITDADLKKRLQVQYSFLINDQPNLNKIINESRIPFAQVFDNSLNPAARQSDPCVLDSPIFKSRLKTVDDFKLNSNQGKEPKFVDNTKLNITSLEDLRTKGLQVTDEEGYMIIGVFDYGKNNRYDTNSQVVSRNLQDFDNAELFNTLRSKTFMAPENQEVTRQLSKDNNQRTTSDVDQMMVTFEDITNIPSIIERMRVTTDDNSCNCRCHNRRR